MAQTYVKNVLVVRPGEGAERQGILFDKSIQFLFPESSTPPTGVTVIDGGGSVLTPGLVDLHTHGLGAHLFEADDKDLHEGLLLAAKFGTTTVLPTLYRCLQPIDLPHLRKLAAVLSRISFVHVPGFHLEGPFLALPGAGARTLPGDVAHLNDLIDACDGKVLAMSVSPEVSGILPVIERLTELGIAPFITHTRASAPETQRAIDAGARHATHFYDVFPLPPEKDPGVRPVGAVEVLLADPRASLDFICDGVHVDPFAIRASLAAKGPAGIVAITDSNIGAGLPDGVYPTNWGFPVRVAQGAATRNADPTHPGYSTLAGSSLTMNVAVKNLHQWLNLPEYQIWAMASANPSRVVGLLNHGVIRPGAAANLVLWNADFTPRRTWVNGRLVYQDSGEIIQ